ncbi:MAG TPA: radical SAM protein [Bacillota bacterium]|nr:radical SAM protein [Bacillota bacterium]
MRYEGNIYRPPSEARSLLIQVTIGCAHNECTFCSMFKDKKFRVRPMEEIMEDLEDARRTYNFVEKIFLCDGDALCLSFDKLMTILRKIKDIFPECKRVTVYGSPQDVLRKTEEELKGLYEAGVEIIYIGAESGSDKVLKNVKKGADRKEIIESVKKIEEAKIKASVTFISGLGGRELWREHAKESGAMISEMQPSYVGLLTLMTEPEAPLTDDIAKGGFLLLTAEEVVAETLLMLKNINVKKECIFRSNHASNYVSLRGTLPRDKDMMIKQLENAVKNKGMLKDERFRML